MFYQLTAKMGDVHEDKNQDYADTSDPFKNFRNSDIGITDVQSVVSRMGDKWARVKKIARGEELSVKDETVEDTFIDLANLSLIALIVHKESRGTA